MFNKCELLGMRARTCATMIMAFCGNMIRTWVLDTLQDYEELLLLLKSETLIYVQRIGFSADRHQIELWLKEKGKNCVLRLYFL